MNMQSLIDNELSQFSSDANEAKVNRNVSVAVDGGQIECTLTAVDSLACAFESITLSTNYLADASEPRLRQVAEDLAKRLNYLLEKVSLVEIDEALCAIQMRSQPPARNANVTAYYELIVRVGEIQLSRYSKTPGRPRHVIPATVTREVFQRIAADFVAVAGCG